MFGYVKPEKSNLRFKEYDLYKASYCGLCHAMAGKLGCLSRFTLSYDMAFFAIVRRYLNEESPTIEKKRCIRHPIIKQEYVKTSPSLDFTALMSAILSEGKLEDTIKDEKSIKKISAKLTRSLLKSTLKKGKEEYPEIAEKVHELLDKLANLEHNKIASVDAPAEVFGEILGFMLSYGLDGEKRILANKIGIALGKYVYMADALDDYESDKKKGSYNPFVLMFKDGIEDKKEIILSSICAELKVLGDSFELLEMPENSIDKEIIKNIIYLGLPAKIKEILSKKGQKQ